MNKGTILRSPIKIRIIPDQNFISLKVANCFFNLEVISSSPNKIQLFIIIDDPKGSIEKNLHLSVLLLKL